MPKIEGGHARSRTGGVADIKADRGLLQQGLFRVDIYFLVRYMYSLGLEVGNGCCNAGEMCSEWGRGVTQRDH